MAALVSVATAAAVAGCGTPNQPGGSTTAVPDGGVGFGWFAYAPLGATDASGRPVGTPVDAVERSGLRLPATATVTEVGTHGGPIGTESYLFAFRVDRSTATAFCEQGGLGGAVAVPRDVSDDVMAALGSPRVTEGSRWCASTSTTHPAWSRYALVDPGDPTTVHLALQRGQQR